MREWGWATILTIAGASLEVAGLAFVFIELAFIRSHEFGILPPWERTRQRLWRLFRRPVTVTASACAGAIAGGLAARGVVRPGDPAPHATDQERIVRLERYVECIDRDLSGMWNTMGESRDAAIREAKRGDEEIRQEMDRREEDRRDKLKPSLRRQKWGALLVFAGLAIGTVGNVI